MKFVFLTAVFLLDPSRASPAMATESVNGFVPILSFDYALRLAEENNADLRAAGSEVAASEAALAQLGKMSNPELAYSIEDFKSETRTTTLQVSQVFELGGKRSARIGAGERTRDVAIADRTIKLAEVRSSVSTAFFDVLIGQERMALAEAALGLAQRATDIAGKRVASGKVSPVEDTKARLAQANVRLELAQAKSDLIAAHIRLCGTWNADAQCFGIARGNPADVPDTILFEDLATIVKRSPAVQRAAVELDRRIALANVEQTRQSGNVTVSIGVKRAEEIGRNQALVGLSVPLPLFDRNQGTLLEALRRTDKARDELVATESRLRMDLQQAQQQLITAHEAIVVLREDILPGAQSAYDAALKGFEFGKFTFLEALDAQRTLLQAKTQYLAILATLHRTRADLDRLIAAPAVNQTLKAKKIQ